MTLAQRFKNCLAQAGATVASGGPFTSSPANLCDAVWAVYRRLNGVQSRDELKARPGNWDMRVDGVFVELDEHQHFNRYRLLTLESPVYTDLMHFPLAEYRAWCVQRERECRKKASRGNYWTTQKSKEQFGPPAPPGNLPPPEVIRDVAEVDVTRGTGSPRWRQRALYDFVKDAWILCSNARACRVSIWELVEVGGTTKTVHDWLMKGPASNALDRALLDLVRRRTFGKR